MKNIFRKNQVIITALAIMIAVAGYLNFTKDKVDDKQVANDITSNDIFSELNEGTYDVTEDGTLLDLSEEDIKDGELPVEEAEATEETDATQTAAIDVKDTGELAATEETTETADATDAKETPGEAVLASTTINASYFSSVKLEREQTRSRSKESYMEIVDNDKITEDQKQEAIDRVIQLTAIAEKENATEILLGAQGYENVVVSMIEGKVNVIVGNKGLTEQQIAQIEDTTKTTTGVKADKIVIKPVEVKEE